MGDKKEAEMKKTKTLLRMYWNHGGFLVCEWYDEKEMYYGSNCFMGYSKKAVIEKLRANGVSVGRGF